MVGLEVTVVVELACKHVPAWSLLTIVEGAVAVAVLKDETDRPQNVNGRAKAATELTSKKVGKTNFILCSVLLLQGSIVEVSLTVYDCEG